MSAKPDIFLHNGFWFVTPFRGANYGVAAFFDLPPCTDWLGMQPEAKKREPGFDKAAHEAFLRSLG